MPPAGRLIRGVAGLLTVGSATTVNAGILLEEALGNWMNAVEVTAEFGTFTTKSS